jgi:hypothetical protein
MDIEGWIDKSPIIRLTALILGGLAVLVVVVGVPFVCIAKVGGADGRHVGFVTAVEQQKNLTWDSTVVYFKTNPESTQEDTYCVVDPEVRDTLEVYARKRQTVEIRYQNDLVMWRQECNGGGSIITEVHALSPERE